MRQDRWRCFGAVPLCAALLLPGVPAVAEDAVYEAQIRPLVQAYCVECHNAEKTKGDLNLARFETHASVVEAIAIWQRAGKRAQEGEMPPKKAPQPTPEERKALVEWISALQADNQACNQVASEASASWYPGYVMSRRLNRQEYENTVSDLLGMDLELAPLFPADGAGGEGFDNDGSALFLSAIQVEKYLQAADYAVEEAFSGKPEKNRASKRPASGLQQDKPDRAARALRIPTAPRRGASEQDAAAQAIAAFAERAWRRPLDAEELPRLVALFEKARDEGKRFEDALKFVFKAVLVSPHFIFLAEPEPEAIGEYELGGYPLASRISYFLWGSLPDEELRERAASGALNNPDELRYQVQRMLRDPRSEALGEIFATQWLGIVQLGETTKPDKNEFPEFDAVLAQDMRREAVLYFHRIVSEDRSLLELIDAKYTYVNERLAAIYGIPDVTGEELRLAEFDDPNRGGVMGMAAVLTATSHPLRTSPVLRGKWVLEQILGDRVPPPPPNVPSLGEEDRHPEGLSMRQRMEAHRENPECASCHARMDPIGFGLENFDPIGRWRTEQAGHPIDATGELPSGERFDGPQALKTILMNRKDEFARNLTRKMLGYALGRSLTNYDNCVIDDCMKALQESNYAPSALFTEIVLSYPFRHRYSGGHLETEVTAK
ncbi:MAG: DUF1592 domain-containing protein [Candidatus Hydrogenedentes bacterium]|nr:DUF1592 domain-containing protein [Candidatus Hydrogenedentota bacterium]